MRGRRIRIWVVRPLLATALVATLAVGTRLRVHNFGTVVPGRIYRSAQMEGESLAVAVRDHHIKTVLNLRGSNPDQSWYRAEKAATLAGGATQVDVHMASDLWLTRAEARTLVKILDTCEYPLLIHCQWGSERTGLVSAFAELLRPGSTLADGRRQFSLHYLFVPAGNGAVMAKHLDRYAEWLRAQGDSHSPETFRRWVADGYRPRHPSREEWPYYPYPLITTTRPQPQRPEPMRLTTETPRHREERKRE